MGWAEGSGGLTSGRAGAAVGTRCLAVVAESSTGCHHQSVQRDGASGVPVCPPQCGAQPRARQDPWHFRGGVHCSRDRVDPRTGICCPCPSEHRYFFQEQHEGAGGSSVGTRASPGGSRSPLCCWQSTRTRGHPPGSSQGRWKLTSPGRQQCLASHSGLVNLNVNLVTKLITNVPSPARVGCPLGSALHRLLRHLWSLSLLDSSCLAASACGRTWLVPCGLVLGKG